MMTMMLMMVKQQDGYPVLKEPCFRNSQRFFFGAFGGTPLNLH